MSSVTGRIAAVERAYPSTGATIRSAAAANAGCHLFGRRPRPRLHPEHDIGDLDVLLRPRSYYGAAHARRAAKDRVLLDPYARGR
jgi:hypothetical protein